MMITFSVTFADLICRHRFEQSKLLANLLTKQKTYVKIIYIIIVIKRRLFKKQYIKLKFCFFSYILIFITREIKIN